MGERSPGWLRGSSGDPIHDAVDAQLRAADLEPPALAYRLSKRTLDIVLALALLLLTLPVMVLAAIAIRLDSRGSVFFRQERCGCRGERFTMLKFRTMKEGAHSERESVRPLDISMGPTFKAREDPRATRVGRRLRTLSIDELPQLWNVLRGDMSIVGPRPLVCAEVEQLPDSALVRLGVPPGLTCIWQVSGRSLVTFEEWMAMDVRYVRTRSLWLDLRIMARTPIAVITRRGAF